MLKQINLLREKGHSELKAINNTDQLPDWYHQYLGRKGELTAFLKQLGTIKYEDRPAVGKIINDVKQEFQQIFDFCSMSLTSNLFFVFSSLT